MSATKIYTVVYGDYLAKIAQEHGTTVGAIWSHPANAEHRAKRGSPDVLYPGDVLHIPVATPPPPPPQQTPPPQTIPPGPPPLLGPPPKTYPWQHRGLARGKAKTGGVQKHALRPRLDKTDVLLVGEGSRQMIEDGWLLAGPDRSAIGTVRADQALIAAYQAHFATSYPAALAWQYADDPAELAKQLSRVPALVPTAVYHLTIDPSYRAPFDPFRYHALVELAQEGRFDIMKTDVPLTRDVQIDRAPPPGLTARTDLVEKGARGATFLSEPRERALRQQIDRSYTSAELVATLSLTFSAQPDPNRDVVVVVSPPAARNDKRQASLAHELFGHLLLARRKCISDHVQVKSRAATRRANVADPPIDVLSVPISRPPLGPFGVRFAGIGAQHREPVPGAIPKPPAKTVEPQPVGPPGFTELFASTHSETTMVPTLGVGAIEGGLGYWADRHLDLLKVVAAASQAGHVSVDDSSGLARIESPLDGSTMRIDLRPIINGLNNHHLCLMRLHHNDAYFNKGSVSGKTGASGKLIGATGDFEADAAAFRKELRSVLEAMSGEIREHVRQVVEALEKETMKVEVRAGSPLSHASVVHGIDQFEGLMNWPMQAGPFKSDTLVTMWAHGRL